MLTRMRRRPRTRASWGQSRSVEDGWEDLGELCDWEDGRGCGGRKKERVGLGVIGDAEIGQNFPRYGKLTIPTNYQVNLHFHWPVLGLQPADTSLGCQSAPFFFYHAVNDSKLLPPRLWLPQHAFLCSRERVCREQPSTTTPSYVDPMKLLHQAWVL